LSFYICFAIVADDAAAAVVLQYVWIMKISVSVFKD
jgi:hypothetical protein